MLKFFNNVKLEDMPALILRALAVGLILVQLFIAVFIVNHYRSVFVLTSIVFSLLLAREMYEDLAQRFFRLKAEEYEHELEKLRAQQADAAEEPQLMIEGTSQRGEA
ncbi:hypothetical protein Ga0609869_000279 [Rhodovulum iodosum]|uniref:DUF4229 domain-containing protein n=1 Tax=Rhodovulum iodosum TaxID=68291 RepID=A0ABV3XNN4_9RHOB|nr:hypothetical protein [Rhodovulum robiginosum]RSK34822.1 hypothetical protein EJA01_07675 [Rhodovulum robiginosum]